MSKKSYLRIPEYLRHIIDAIQKIERYTADITEVNFLNDEKTQDAVVRNLEIIGEAANNILKGYPEFAEQYPDIPLLFAYEMRNVVSHGYHKVDFELVWNTVQMELSGLLTQVEEALKSFN
jgi:uncharacterized protein with HEPN domain